MEKQEHFDLELKQEKDKYNKVTAFLSKFIFSTNFDILKKIGFVDSYISDPKISEIVTPSENQRLLFLLFKNKKMNNDELKKVILDLAQVPVHVVFSYDLINDYTMIVIDFPIEFIVDYDNVVAGKYSKLSEGFKSKFPLIIDRKNTKNQIVGREYTIYYHIFNKTDWLKKFWMERLDLIEISDNLELWHSPDEKDLIFNIKNIVNDK